MLDTAFVRGRLFRPGSKFLNPPNAVRDDGINMRNGSPVGPPRPAPLKVVYSGIPPAELQPPDVAKIPAIVREIADMVADAHGLTSTSVMAGVLPAETRARRIAAALSVRRAFLTRQEVAREFGIHEAVVTAALMALDPILIESQISVTRAPLMAVVNIVVSAWARYDMPSKTVPVGEILDAVARVFNVSKHDLKSACRLGSIIKPRHIAMALTRRLTLRSMPDIGRCFGDRDHTTVLHACRKMQPIIDKIEPQMREDSTALDWAYAAYEALNAR